MAVLAETPPIQAIHLTAASIAWAAAATAAAASGTYAFITAGSKRAEGLKVMAEKQKPREDSAVAEKDHGTGDPTPLNLLRRAPVAKAIVVAAEVGASGEA